ncbi:MAG TPA: prepilin-type N-terminal cleavage/methylation domain-containing protein [Desulfuromonadales bacterium]|nr:prepilin-type N-terminal cleavage/methylation domain-containing protein [Desulfuromonadales bacterium]
MSKAGKRGFSLLELLMAIALLALLTAAGTWGGAAILRDWQVRRAAHQLEEDLECAQRQTEQRGSVGLVNGRLLEQHSFLVFQPQGRSYTFYRWQDIDGNGVPDAGEAVALWDRSLPPGIDFGWTADVDRRACSNPIGLPGRAVTFARPDYPPCHDRPCIKFDSLGTSVIGPGAVYLSNGSQSFALSLTRPGVLTICRWNGSKWQ